MHVVVRQAVARLLAEQDGVAARSQLRDAGASEADLRRALRRRELTVVHEGVYVDHTGPRTWQQRAWAAVLAVAPAALYGVSALRAADGPGRRAHHDDGPIHVAVDRSRRSLRRLDGVRVHHLTDLTGRSLWNVGPPRVRVEHVALDLAARAPDELGAVAILSDVVQARRTTAERLLTTLDARPRIARRSFLAGVLRDVADGTCSVLEHGYLTRVERPHGLPRAHRQLAAHGPRGRVLRDAAYVEQRQLVELDGRLFHEGARARDDDLDRDLLAAAAGEHTIRLGWGQVFGRPCLTAGRVASVLQRRGWTGRLHRCPLCPVEP